VKNLGGAKKRFFASLRVAKNMLSMLFGASGKRLKINAGKSMKKKSGPKAAIEAIMV
jgi:hypothetical protein